MATATNEPKPPPTAESIQRRRSFTQKLNLRRKIYRELTSYQVFPLQEMAMRDLDDNLKDYSSVDNSSDDERDDEVVRCDAVKKTALADIKPKLNGAAGSTNNKTVDLPTDLESLREKYTQEFLREKSNPSSCFTFHANVPIEEVESSQSEQQEGCELSHNQAATAKENVPQSCENKQDITEATAPNENESPSKQPNLIPQTLQKDQSTPQQQQQQNTSSVPQNNTPQLSTLWSMEPRIFALETTGSGKRRYISCHLGRFMDHYWRECDVYSRHYYELIREGMPCRLYFDLEFNKLSNRDITDEIAECLLNELFDEVNRQFETMYNITIQRHHLVDLDSSTNKKFSRHWIFHLPNSNLFPDARATGSFVKLLVARLEEEQKSGMLKSKGHALLAKYLFVNAEDSNKDGEVKLTRFIDMGVYTRNRLFRLMGSTKFGKRPDAALRIASANKFPFPKEFCNAKFYLPEIKLDKEESGCKTPDAESDKSSSELDFERFCKSHYWEDHATALENTLVVPAHTTKCDYPILPDPISLLEDGSQQKLILESGIGYRAAKPGLNGSLRPSCSYGKSPFHKLEYFVANTLGQRKGLEGSISTYSLGTQQPPRTISYNMTGNRYCENIGRAHKSNKIYWNVHLIDRVCYQCCHDPDCRGFRGERIDLPEEVNAEIDDYYLEYELASLCIDNRRVLEEHENAPGDEEFDDPVLEEAIRNLNISSVVDQSKKVLDVEEFHDPALEEALRNLEL